MPKNDFIGECSSSSGLPEQEVMAANCVRCLQAECVRSQFGKSGFDSRVTTWEDRLFRNPARMDLSDSRIHLIQAKQFVPMPVGHGAEIWTKPQSAWLDPRDLNKPPPTVVAPPAVVAPIVAPTPPAPTPPSPSPPPAQEVFNTPVQSGVMLGGRPAPPPPPPKADPWAVKKPTETKGLPVIKPGGKFRFGG